jgi:hypothetical protein
VTIKVSNANEFSNHDEKSLSDFGKYDLQKEITLRLPNNVITLCDLGGGKFSYSRNSQNETIKKIIHNIRQIETIKYTLTLRSSLDDGVLG